MFLMFATSIFPRRASNAIAPGNQPTGIKPSSFDSARVDNQENRDGVLGAVADEKFFARPVKRQRVRLRAEGESLDSAARKSSPQFCPGALQK